MPSNTHGGKRPNQTGRPPTGKPRKVRHTITIDPLFDQALALLPGRGLSDKIDTLLRTVPLVQMALARVQKED